MSGLAVLVLPDWDPQLLAPREEDMAQSCRSFAPSSTKRQLEAPGSLRYNNLKLLSQFPRENTTFLLCFRTTCSKVGLSKSMATHPKQGSHRLHAQGKRIQM